MKKHAKKSTPPMAEPPRPYELPVSRLLELGDVRGYVREGLKWKKHKFDYAAMGFAPEHVSELLRMAADPRLLWADPESVEVWAPVHAWRVLGRLRAAEAVPVLVEMIEELEEDDSPGEELPRVFSQIGAPSIEPLAALVRDRKRGEHARFVAAECLERIGLAHRDLRPACVAALTSVLEEFQRNDEQLNGFLILSLAEMEADEALPLIERAFEADMVDVMVMGDLNTVRARFGLPPSRPPAQSIARAARGTITPIDTQPTFSRHIARKPRLDL